MRMEHDSIPEVAVTVGKTRWSAVTCSSIRLDLHFMQSLVRYGADVTLLSIVAT